MTSKEPGPIHATRRQVLAGAALAGGAVAGGPLLAACSDTGGKAPSERQQTLFIAGFQWGPPPNFNPLVPTAGFPTAQKQWQLIYETLFLFDLLDGSIKPQLGASFSQPDARTFEVKLQADAKWQDGKPVTADDVVYSYELGQKNKDLPYSSHWEYLSGITKVDDKTVRFGLNAQRLNPGMVKVALSEVYILPSHLWKTYESQNAKIIEFANNQPVGSGPYKIDSFNAQQIIYSRDDNYWGKSVRGKLPAPKKIVHPIFKDNAAGNLAFERGEVDVMQQFIPEIWKLWQDKKLPVGTWYDQSPYYIPGGLPMLTVNCTKKGLDNPKVRRALAHAIDYSRIAETAMSRYSEPAKSSLILPTDAEKQYRDDAAIASNGWKFDPAKAKQILETELGATKGADGIYKLADGTRLGPWKVETPNGWSDWMAAVQLVVEAGKAAGFDLSANFPEANTLTPAVQNGNYDLAVFYIGAATNAATPWARYRDVLDMRGVLPIGQSSFHNYGRFSDSRVAALLDKAASATGAEQVAAVKELDVIFMQNAPMIPLMYRPVEFFEYHEKVWTGFPNSKNAKAAPLFQGTGALWLYEISPK